MDLKIHTWGEETPLKHTEILKELLFDVVFEMLTFCVFRPTEKVWGWSDNDGL